MYSRIRRKMYSRDGEKMHRCDGEKMHRRVRRKCIAMSEENIQPCPNKMYRRVDENVHLCPKKMYCRVYVLYKTTVLVPF
jgi:hypothetical protein